MKALLKSLFLLLTVLVPISYAQVFVDPETRGVWVPAGFSPYDSAGIETMMKNLSSANFNVIYLGVWDGQSSNAGTIYPSKVVSDAGGPVQYPEFVGGDPLRTYIDIAHKYGMEVVAWFELMPLDISVSKDSTDLPLLLRANPSWSLVQRDTTKVGYHLTGYGYYFGIDPAVTKAANFVVNLYTELAKNYPDVDGIESDIENDTTFSYSYIARSRFMQETGNPDPLTLPSNNAAWFSWRCLQVTNIVQRIYQGVKQVNPQCVIAGAVDPQAYGGLQPGMLESWDVWAKSSYVDILEPMMYLPTSSFDNQLKWCLVHVPAGFQLSAGIDLSGNSLSDVITEIKDSRSNSTAGQIIWYYSPVSPSGTLATLKSQLYTAKALPSYDDLLIDNSRSGLFHTVGSWAIQRGGYKGSYVTSQAVAGDTAFFTVRVLRSGDYTLYGYWSGDSSSNSAHAVIQTSTGLFSKSDTIDQKLNLNSWSYAGKFYLNSGDTVTVKLFGNDGGNLVADAFRLRRGSPFMLEDCAVPDSQTILLKFSNRLLYPASLCTRVFTSSGKTGVSFFVDPGDNTVLHVQVPIMERGIPVALAVDSLVDVSYDTLNVVRSVTYDPDSTVSLVDDQTAGAFWKFSGTWIEDTSSSAVNGEYWLTKQAAQVARAEWGPLKINVDGYYDVYVKIPETNFPLSTNCVYLVSEHFGTDSIHTSQASAAGTWLKLANCPLKSGDQFAVLLSSLGIADTSKYLVADAAMIKRSVEITGFKETTHEEEENFSLSDNYPNPFNPSTMINYQLPMDSRVTIDIYNVLGQKVESRYKGIKGAGRYEDVVNMEKFTSGVYFYRVDAVGDDGQRFTAVKKLVLVK